MEISEAVEGIWQRALALAAQSAKNDENAAREHLERLRVANEVRDQSITLREREWDARDREREAALTDARDQQLATLRLLSKDRATLAAQERRIGELEKLNAGYREQLAAIGRRLAAPARPSRGKSGSRPGRPRARKVPAKARAASARSEAKKTDKARRPAKRRTAAIRR